MLDDDESGKLTAIKPFAAAVRLHEIAALLENGALAHLAPDLRAAADELERLLEMEDVAFHAGECAAEIDRLREALEPFARWAEALDRDFADHADDVIAGGLAGHYEVTLGDIRRARNLFNS